ncbi:hypothetical protein FGIG_09628 [Fasciola gigantica]|uniref:Uncharacterized protein n=1 Tax=Fasciola gigantica TaxID=46835 RepID=A0A504YXK5_FASGI|nr:hypothetical protein FGIG_09628 [Fasciola gigantica]
MLKVIREFSYGLVVPKIKSSFSYDESVKSVKYLTPLRALREFILTPEAYEKHGGKEAFELRRKIIKDMERRAKADIFNLKKALKYFKNSLDSHKLNPSRMVDKRDSLFTTGAGRVVLFAIAVYVISCSLVPYDMHFGRNDAM